jgi:hypothetical protein
VRRRRGLMSDHEDVLRRQSTAERAMPEFGSRKLADAIDAVLAEVESLRAERERLSREMLGRLMEQSIHFNEERDRLEAALLAARRCRNHEVICTCEGCVMAFPREALAPSAPEPAPAEPWVQCTDHMNLAKPRCLGGCRTRAEHERYTAKPEPAPAPAEGVCR